MYIRQISVKTPLANFTYLVGCPASRQAVIIDPAGETSKVFSLAQSEDYTIIGVVNTHSHYDHVVDVAEIVAQTGARVYRHPDEVDLADVDVFVNDNDAITVGQLTLRVIHTPGHSKGSVCLYAVGHLFSGDTLFVGDSGRTDLPGGHRPTLGASLRKLFDTLPAETVVWPGHDLGKTPTTTLGRERRENINAAEYGFALPD